MDFPNVFLFRALDKVDSAGIKNIEAFFGQKLGGGMGERMVPKCPEQPAKNLNNSCRKKDIQIVAMGVIVSKKQSRMDQSL